MFHINTQQRMDPMFYGFFVSFFAFFPISLHIAL